MPNKNTMTRDSVFISYSHLDKKWLDEIKKPLSVLQHNHKMIIWDDSKIKVGSNWKDEIQKSIDKSKVAILLVSNNFLASEFIVKKELPSILKAAKKEGLVIFNIIIDVCAYNLTELNVFHCLNNPEFPLEDLERRERKQSLVKLATELLDVISQSDVMRNDKNDDMVNDDNLFCYMVLVLKFLIKKETGSITDIQKALGIKRKIVVFSLEKLQEIGHCKKMQVNDKKKPSSLWKASLLGTNILNQFEIINEKISELTK
jgi:hypothetical protein